MNPFVQTKQYTDLECLSLQYVIKYRLNRDPIISLQRWALHFYRAKIEESSTKTPNFVHILRMNLK